jgi:hypothetical protein
MKGAPEKREKTQHHANIYFETMFFAARPRCLSHFIVHAYSLILLNIELSSPFATK